MLPYQTTHQYQIVSRTKFIGQMKRKHSIVIQQNTSKLIFNRIKSINERQKCGSDHYEDQFWNCSDSMCELILNVR